MVATSAMLWVFVLRFFIWRGSRKPPKWTVFRVNLPMAQYYGVECKTCEGTLALGQCAEEKIKTFYFVLLEAIVCRACGSSHLYGSDDLFEFEGADNIRISGQL